MCASPSDNGGANNLVDGLATLAGLQTDPSRRWVAERLESTAFELTTTHEALSADGSPVAYTKTRVVNSTPTGRKQLLPAVDNIKPLDSASPAERAVDKQVLLKWREAIDHMEPRSVALKKGHNRRYKHW